MIQGRFMSFVLLGIIQYSKNNSRKWNETKLEL